MYQAAEKIIVARSNLKNFMVTVWGSLIECRRDASSSTWHFLPTAEPWLRLLASCRFDMHRVQIMSSTDQSGNSQHSLKVRPPLFPSQSLSHSMMNCFLFTLYDIFKWCMSTYLLLSDIPTNLHLRRYSMICRTRLTFAGNLYSLTTRENRPNVKPPWVCSSSETTQPATQ